MTKVLTLCLIVQDDKLLLGLKKRGFGKGRWNGFGGKVEEAESIEAAAGRELKEESGLDVEQMEKRGVLNFSFKHSGENLEVHVFKVIKFSGQPTESDEMKPEWFSLDKIPFDEMWADDRF